MGPNLLGIVLLAAACVFALPYVLGPALVFIRTRFRTPIEVVAVDPAGPAMPADVRAYFDQTYRPLTQVGFELVGCVSLPAALRNVQVFAACYANRTTNELASATFFLAGNPPTQRAGFVSFITRYSDGFFVQTNNSNVLSSFKPRPNERTIQFPEVHDVTLLYRLHAHSVAQHRPGIRPYCRFDEEFRGDAIAYFRAIVEEDLTKQVDSGIMARTAAGYRPSVFGACWMTWRELWPTKAIRIARRQRLADRLLADYYAAAAYGASTGPHAGPPR